MTDEQTIRQRAAELAIDLTRQGLATSSASANEDDIVRAAKKLSDFIADGTVPEAPEA